MRQTMILTSIRASAGPYGLLTPRWYRRFAVRPLLATLFVLAALPATTAAAPLRTAVVADTDDPLAFQRIHQAGATMVRLNLSWAAVTQWRPADPADPLDPAYDWRRSDRLVKLAASHGLQTFVTVWNAPSWAEAQEPHPTHQGPIPVRSWRPNPEDFAAFGRALTTRYSGSLPGIPRVHYWEIWDEPNLTQYLSPQLEKDVVVSPDIYRGLVNAFADAAHSVRRDNVVIAGSLSAFSFETEWGRLGIAPMLFMRKLLCMSNAATPKPTCNKKV